MSLENSIIKLVFVIIVIAFSCAFVDLVVNKDGCWEDGPDYLRWISSILTVIDAVIIYFYYGMHTAVIYVIGVVIALTILLVLRMIVRRHRELTAMDDEINEFNKNAMKKSEEVTSENTEADDKETEQKDQEFDSMLAIDRTTANIHSTGRRKW